MCVLATCRRKQRSQVENLLRIDDFVSRIVRRIVTIHEVRHECRLHLPFVHAGNARQGEIAQLQRLLPRQCPIVQVQAEVPPRDSRKGNRSAAPTGVTAINRLHARNLSPVLTVVAHLQATQRRQVLPPHAVVFLLHRPWHIHAARLRSVPSIHLIRHAPHRHASPHVGHDDLLPIIHSNVAIGVHRIMLPARLRNRKCQHRHRSVKFLLRHGSLQQSVEVSATTNHRVAAHQHLHPQFFRYPRSTSTVAVREMRLELQAHPSGFLRCKHKHLPPLRRESIQRLLPLAMHLVVIDHTAHTSLTECLQVSRDALACRSSFAMKPPHLCSARVLRMTESIPQGISILSHRHTAPSHAKHDQQPSFHSFIPIVH